MHINIHSVVSVVLFETAAGLCSRWTNLNQHTTMILLSFSGHLKIVYVVWLDSLQRDKALQQRPGHTCNWCSSLLLTPCTCSRFLATPTHGSSDSTPR